MGQVYTDRMVTSLRANEFVAQLVHVVFLNSIKTFCRFLIDHGYTMAGLLLVCTTNDEQNEHDELIEN